MGIPKRNLSDRFWEKVEIGRANNCWPWRAHLHEFGYGLINIDGVPRRAHRVAYELEVGPVPKNHDLHHLCENRRCVNPKHLEPLSRSAHMAQTPAWIGNKTHCSKGHEYTNQNTIWKQGKYRRCRTCWNEAEKLRRRKVRARKKK